MSYLNFRGTVLVLVQAMLLAACSSPSDEPAQQSALPPQQSAPAQEAARAPVPAPEPSPDASQPGTAALREFVDPVTGQSRAPTSAELKALEAASKSTTVTAQAASKPREKEIVFPDGTVAVEEGSLSQMKACVQKDGAVTVDHDCKVNAPVPVKKP